MKLFSLCLLASAGVVASETKISFQSKPFVGSWSAEELEMDLDHTSDTHTHNAAGEVVPKEVMEPAAIVTFSSNKKTGNWLNYSGMATKDDAFMGEVSFSTKNQVGDYSSDYMRPMTVPMAKPTDMESFSSDKNVGEVDAVVVEETLWTMYKDAVNEEDEAVMIAAVITAFVCFFSALVIGIFCALCLCSPTHSFFMCCIVNRMKGKMMEMELPTAGATP